MSDVEFDAHLRTVFDKECFLGQGQFQPKENSIIKALLKMSFMALEVEVGLRSIHIDKQETAIDDVMDLVSDCRCIQATTQFLGYIIDKDCWDDELKKAANE